MPTRHKLMTETYTRSVRLATKRPIVPMLCLFWVGLTIERLCFFIILTALTCTVSISIFDIFLTAMFCLNVNFELNVFENVNLAVIYFFVEIVIFFYRFLYLFGLNSHFACLFRHFLA